MSKKPRIRFPKLSNGFKRQWLQCRECSRVYFYDYVPYGLSNPLRWLPCGHSPIGDRYDIGANEITEEEASPIYIEQQARAALERAKKE